MKAMKDVSILRTVVLVGWFLMFFGCRTATIASGKSHNGQTVLRTMSKTKGKEYVSPEMLSSQTCDADAIIRKRFSQGSGTFKASSLSALSSKEFQIVCPYSKEKLERVLADALLNDPSRQTMLRLFVACTQERSLQAKFAARCLVLWPDLASNFMDFYSDNPSEHLAWCAEVGHEMDGMLSPFDKRGHLRLNLALCAAYSVHDDEELMLRSFWSSLLGRPVSLQECADAVENGRARKMLSDLAILNRSLFGPEILLHLSPFFPKSFWSEAWREYFAFPAACQGYVLFYYLGLLAGENPLPQKGGTVFSDESFEKWKSLAEHTYASQIEELLEGSAAEE